MYSYTYQQKWHNIDTFCFCLFNLQKNYLWGGNPKNPDVTWRSQAVLCCTQGPGQARPVPESLFRMCVCLGAAWSARRCQQGPARPWGSHMKTQNFQFLGYFSLRFPLPVGACQVEKQKQVPSLNLLYLYLWRSQGCWGAYSCGHLCPPSTGSN